MRALALALTLTAAAYGAYDSWTSREAVLKATQAFSQKLDVLQTALTRVKPSAALADQWRAVKQQSDAMEALVSTNAPYEEVVVQFKTLAIAIAEARRLMYLEGVCYNPAVADRYQAVRLAHRRLDRNMQGLPAEE